MARTMTSAILVRRGRIERRERSAPEVRSLDALLRITTTIICGTAARILKGSTRPPMGSPSGTSG